MNLNNKRIKKESDQVDMLFSGLKRKNEKLESKTEIKKI